MYMTKMCENYADHVNMYMMKMYADLVSMCIMRMYEKYCRLCKIEYKFLVNMCDGHL
jgi:hypothetical protein